MFNCFTILLLVSVFIVGLCFLILSSLLAVKFESRNLSKYVFGYIMGAYAVSALISTILLPYLIRISGRSTIFYAGLFMMSLMSISLGFVPMIENDILMVAAAFG